MKPSEILFLSRKDVARVLTIEECIAGVENAFRLHAEGKVLPPKVLGFHTENGGFHIKAAALGSEQTYFVTKVNGNFPGNPKLHGLPTIQGVIVLCDAVNGRVLALMDSIEITILRTGAATAVATKYLAAPDSKVVTICGCGNQGRISLQALLKVRKLEKAYAFDVDELRAEKFAKEFAAQLEVIRISSGDLHGSLTKSQICVTCTPSTVPFIGVEHIVPGIFIAAVGADSEQKQELSSELVASNKIVVDVAEQSATIGELHHAIKQRLITVTGIHAELGDIITGKKPGRESDREIIIFDSTGTALQDVASAAIVYKKAIANGVGTKLSL